MVGGFKIASYRILQCFPVVAILKKHQRIARRYGRDHAPTQMLGRKLKELRMQEITGTGPTARLQRRNSGNRLIRFHDMQFRFRVRSQVFRRDLQKSLQRNAPSFQVHTIDETKSIFVIQSEAYTQIGKPRCTDQEWTSNLGGRTSGRLVIDLLNVLVWL